MPEYPEIVGFTEAVILKNLRQVKPPPKPPPKRRRHNLQTTFEYPQEQPDKSTQYRLVIHPEVFSVGTETKSYTSLTIDTTKYTVPPSTQPLQIVNEDGSPNYRNIRSVNSSWQHLLGVNTSGPLLCARRGKLMILAAGNHAALLHFGLEAHLMHMTRADYEEILQNEAPGSNSDGPKSQLLRSFILPARFTVENSSSPETPRTVNFFIAFVSDKDVYVAVDFARLIRGHIISRDVVWVEADLDSSSPGYEALWEPFKGGPDWLNERSRAEAQLDVWKAAVLERHAAFICRVKKWDKLNYKHSTYTIDTHFRPKSSKQISKAPVKAIPPKPILPVRPIIKDICRNSHRAFSGLGRHCANDLLYHLALHPGTPSYIICLDIKLYVRFKNAIYIFLARFISPNAFLLRSATRPNTTNPFDFNKKSNDDYMSSYIDVFRRVKVKVPKDLYNLYQRQGLLDPEHTIGDLYPEHKIAPIKRSSKWAFVYLIKAPLKAYTIIIAKLPVGYATGEKMLVTKDIGLYRYSTTIGCAQFREYLLNQIDDRLDMKKLVYSPTGGSRRKVKTGKRGRPRMEGRTKDQIKRNIKGRRGRQPAKQVAIDVSEDDSDVSCTSSEEEEGDIKQAVMDLSDEDDGSDNSCTSSDEETVEENTLDNFLHTLDHPPIVPEPMENGSGKRIFTNHSLLSSKYDTHPNETHQQEQDTPNLEPTTAPLHTSATPNGRPFGTTMTSTKAKGIFRFTAANHRAIIEMSESNMAKTMTVKPPAKMKVTYFMCPYNALKSREKESTKKQREEYNAGIVREQERRKVDRAQRAHELAFKGLNNGDSSVSDRRLAKRQRSISR